MWRMRSGHLVFRVRYGTLNINQLKQCESIMEFTLIHFKTLQDMLWSLLLNIKPHFQFSYSLISDGMIFLTPNCLNFTTDATTSLQFSQNSINSFLDVSGLANFFGMGFVCCRQINSLILFLEHLRQTIQQTALSMHQNNKLTNFLNCHDEVELFSFT